MSFIESWFAYFSFYTNTVFKRCAFTSEHTCVCDYFLMMFWLPFDTITIENSPFKCLTNFIEIYYWLLFVYFIVVRLEGEIISPTGGLWGVVIPGGNWWDFLLDHCIFNFSFKTLVLTHEFCFKKLLLVGRVILLNYIYYVNNLYFFLLK